MNETNKTVESSGAEEIPDSTTSTTNSSRQNTRPTGVQFQFQAANSKLPPPPPTTTTSMNGNGSSKSKSAVSFGGPGDERMLIERDGQYRLVTAEEATAEEMRRQRMEEFKKKQGGGKQGNGNSGGVVRPRLPHPPPPRPKTTAETSKRTSLRQNYIASLNGGNKKNGNTSTTTGANSSYVSNSTNISGHAQGGGGRAEVNSTQSNFRDGSSSLVSQSTYNTRMARSADYSLRKNQRMKRFE